MLTFFGMGLLGSNFVRALRRRGEDVHVWNRTASRAKALETDGARAFEDPAEAARGASQIHLTLSEDNAVDDVLEKARPGFAPGVILVDHSTTSPEGTRARAARWKERGVAFQHAPVFMGPQNALEGTGIMLVSGDAAVVERLRPTLEKMTGKLHYVGADPERAAMFKLFGNLSHGPTYQSRGKAVFGGFRGAKDVTDQGQRPRPREIFRPRPLDLRVFACG